MGNLQGCISERLRDRTKITWHKLPAKVPKRPNILLTEYQGIFEPTLRAL